MRKAYMYTTIFLILFTLMTVSIPVSAQAPKCGGCHADMVKNPIALPEAPPADLLLALNTPCFNWGKVLEEWYYVEELFVTIEHHLIELHDARFHVEPWYEELEASRDYFRTVQQEPIVSLADFRTKTGKLRYDVGKVYRTVKEKRIEQQNRTVFGIILLIILFTLILVVTGWRIASGTGVVYKPKTKLGFDDLKEQEAKEKEEAE
ncbi:hypothetical protein ACFL6L_03840 [candidate division KSB1 bacterium]